MKKSLIILLHLFLFLSLSFSISSAGTLAPALERISDSATNFEFSNYILLQKKRVGRTTFEYEYQVNITNTGPDANVVFAYLSSSDPKTVIVDNEVDFGFVPEGATRAGVDTFTIRQDRRYPIDLTKLSWEVTSDLCTIPTLSPPDADQELLTEITYNIIIPTCYSGTATLTYQLVEGPNGMTIDPRTGVLNWMPPENTDGQSFNVKLSVTDGTNVEDLDFVIKVATSTPLQTTVEENKVTITEPGDLNGVSIIIPQEVSASIDLQQINIKKIEESSAPTIPSNISRISAFFRSTPLYSEDGQFVITLPNAVVPIGRYPFEIILFSYTSIHTSGANANKVWVPIQTDMELDANGNISINVGAIGETFFLGIRNRSSSATTTPSGVSSSIINGVNINCEAKVWYIPNPIIGFPPIPITDESCQICKVDGDNDFKATIHDFNDNNWQGSTTIEEVAYWVYQTQSSFDNLDMDYSDSMTVRIEQLDDPNDSDSTGYAGYVTTGNFEGRKTIHLDLDNRWTKTQMTTTTAHEYFHQAQGVTKKLLQENAMSVFPLLADWKKPFWITEGTARWFEDYDSLDGLDTYKSMNGRNLPRILEKGVNAYPGNGASFEYHRFAFWKMVENKCSGFEIRDILNAPSKLLDQSLIKKVRSTFQSNDWDCEFCDGFGDSNEDTLESALLYYQWATIKKGDVSLLDSNETNYTFNRTIKTVDPTSSSSWGRNTSKYSLPANGARSFWIKDISSVASNKEVFLKFNTTGGNAWVSILEGDLDNHGNLDTWFKTEDKTEFQYGESGTGPKLFVTVVNPSSGDDIEFSIETGLRDKLQGELTISTPSASGSYNNRVISVSGQIPSSLSGSVQSVLIEQPFIGGAGGSRNIARVSGSTFNGKAVIKLGENSITVTGLDSSGNKITRPTTVSFTGVEHSNPSAVNALIKSNIVYVLQWDTNGTDIDLYVTDPANRTICYYNRSITGIGRQDYDNTSGYGPEVTTFQTSGSALAGNYEANINYYSGSRNTYYTVDVLLNEGTSAPTVGYYYSSHPNHALTRPSYNSGFPPSSDNASWGANKLQIRCTGSGDDMQCSLR